MSDTTDLSWEQRKEKALFALGYLIGAINGKPEAELVTQAHQELLSFIGHAEWLVGEEELSIASRDRMADLLTRTANVLKGDPTPLSSHSWHDLPESAALAMDPDKKAIREAAASVSLWWAMVEAQAEMAEEPLRDEQVALHFMGSGASHMVMVKDLRAMMAAIYGPQPGSA